MSSEIKIDKPATFTDRRRVRKTENGWEYEVFVFEVHVMAIVGIYAMVRRKGAMPFVAEIKQLTQKP